QPRARMAAGAPGSYLRAHGTRCNVPGRGSSARVTGMLHASSLHEVQDTESRHRMAKYSARAKQIKRITWGAATLLALASGACEDHVGDLSARAGLTVTVERAGANVCNATVTARDGTFSEVLTAFGPASSCTYSGVFERPGNYTLDVIAGTRTKTVTGLAVT